MEQQLTLREHLFAYYAGLVDAGEGAIDTAFTFAFPYMDNKEVGDNRAITNRWFGRALAFLLCVGLIVFSIFLAKVAERSMAGIAAILPLIFYALIAAPFSLIERFSKLTQTATETKLTQSRLYWFGVVTPALLSASLAYLLARFAL